MAKEKILFDKTELVCGIVFGSSASVVNLKYSDIISIKFIPTPEKKLFKTVMSERIEIKCKNQAYPIVYLKSQEKKFWENYKDGLRKFAKDNRITLEDETIAPAQK